MTPPQPRAEPDTASEAGESDAAAESATSQRPAGAELEADIASDEGGSEAAAESPTEQLPDDQAAEAGAASETAESEALTESPTEQPVDEETAAERRRRGGGRCRGPGRRACGRGGLDRSASGCAGAGLGVGCDDADGPGARDRLDHAVRRAERRTQHTSGSRGRSDAGRGARGVERLPGDDERIDVECDCERPADERRCAGQARGTVSAGRRGRRRRRTCALAPRRPALRGGRARSSARVRSGFSLSGRRSRSGPRGSNSNCSRRSAGLSPASTTGSASQRTGSPVARELTRIGSRRSRAGRPRPTSPGLGFSPRPIGADPRPICSGRPFRPTGKRFRPSGTSFRPSGSVR